MKMIVPLMASACAAASAQEALDRVLARVEGYPITLSETKAAIRLGLVEIPAGVDPILSALQQLIERRLVLAEVSRFAPGEPDPAALNGEVNALTARVGRAGLAALEKETGTGETQIREVARDNLRIQAYLNQRFGSMVQPTEDEIGQYYRTHLDEFRDATGRVIPFVEAQIAAREKAAAGRRRALIFQWMRELRQRGDVVEFYPK